MPVFIIIIIAIIVFHTWLHLANPYARVNFVRRPFTTRVLPDDTIVYTQHFTPRVLHTKWWDLLGYYRQGFLIAQNTLVGGKRSQAHTTSGIIADIHTQRFNPRRPYLISGDQFSVLYPRNLGVFYNQLIASETSLSATDETNRLRIYLQSVLYAIEGLSVGATPKTTLVPIAPRTIIATSVHPGDIASDAVYGTLYALDMLSKNPRTADSAQRILREKQSQLRVMVTNWLQIVTEPDTGRIRADIQLASARDGASRSSSFYDNIILWKTRQLASNLGILHTPTSELTKLKNDIKAEYWNEEDGYYNNDIHDMTFSGDWLIGYVTGFFNLAHKIDRERTARTIAYIRATKLADPLPLRYQHGTPKHAPIIIKLFVPNYGGDAIWSYWGAQYITLLVDMYRTTNDKTYLSQAKKYRKRYNAAIVRDGGFAETFDTRGNFLRAPLYKSIRITGWVVQYEYAVRALRDAMNDE